MHFKIPWLSAKDIPNVDFPVCRVRGISGKFSIIVVDEEEVETCSSASGNQDKLRLYIELRRKYKRSRVGR